MWCVLVLTLSLSQHTVHVHMSSLDLSIVRIVLTLHSNHARLCHPGCLITPWYLTCAMKTTSYLTTTDSFTFILPLSTPLTACLLLHFLFFTLMFWLSYPSVSLAATPQLLTSFQPPHCPPTQVVCRPQPWNSPFLCCSTQSNESSFHHSSFPFILSFLSLPHLSHAAFQASPSGCPSHCWPLSCSPHVIFKHCLTTILHVNQHHPSCSESHWPAPHRPCCPPSLALHCHPLLRMGHWWSLLLYQSCAHCHFFIFFFYFPFVPFVHHLSPFVFTPSWSPFTFMPLTPIIHPALTPIWYDSDGHSSYCSQYI